MVNVDLRLLLSNQTAAYAAISNTNPTVVMPLTTNVNISMFGALIYAKRIRANYVQNTMNQTLFDSYNAIFRSSSTYKVVIQNAASKTLSTGRLRWYLSCGYFLQ